MDAKIDNAAMSDEELKRYMLAHRTDEVAFHTYMDRVYTRPDREVIEPDDPEWEAKVLMSFQKQLGDQQ